MWNLFRSVRPQARPVHPMAIITPDDGITTQQLREGCLILGGTGSGKTSGPLRAIVELLLKKRCGILWLCAKQDEARSALAIIERMGRTAEVIHVAPNGPWRFDFLDYELHADGGGVQSAEQFLAELVEFASGTSATQSKEPFWSLSAQRLLRMCLNIIVMAQGTASISDLYQMLTSLPDNTEKLTDKSWQQSFCGTAIGLAAKQHGDDAVAFFTEFLMVEWPNLAANTKSGVFAQALLTIDPFMQGLSHLVTGTSTVTPDDLLEGKIIIVDTPTLKHHTSGRFINTVFKLATQRMALRRDLTTHPREVAIVADEAQEFILKKTDSAVQAVGRSAGLISICATQNIPLIVTALGGTGMEKEASSWLGNFSTKIFCANSEMTETNKYASELCGHHKELFYGGSPGGALHNYDIVDDIMATRSQSASISFNQQWHPQVPPEYFAGQLCKGGEPFDYIVTAIVTQSGRLWSNGKTWILGRWRQHPA